MELWFNPQCSKSRAALKAVEDTQRPYTLRRYLDEPPTITDLDRVLGMLGIEPWDLCRMKEPIAAELGLATLPRDRARWLAVMVQHPILIERPIVVRDDGTAVIARSEAALAEALAPH